MYQVPPTSAARSARGTDRLLGLMIATLRSPTGIVVPVHGARLGSEKFAGQNVSGVTGADAEATTRSGKCSIEGAQVSSQQRLASAGPAVPETGVDDEQRSHLRVVGGGFAPCRVVVETEVPTKPDDAICGMAVFVFTMFGFRFWCRHEPCLPADVTDRPTGRQPGPSRLGRY